MPLQDKRVLLTGASGGIGQALAHELARHKVKLGIVGRRTRQLNALCGDLRNRGCEVVPIIAELTQSEGRDTVIREMQKAYGGIDVLINSAGIQEFVEVADQDPQMMERTLQVNTIAPMQLIRAVLPDMLERGSGQIVNVGSTFGSIGFACFASYSASKFALRGFSEALRREITGSGVNVTYVAPRAVKTALNSAAVHRMADAVKMNMDEPASVAKQIVKAIDKRKKDVYLGFPESLFVRINGILPRLVDAATRKQNSVMRRFTHEN
ncbi:MAG: SDR family oxidoreductase [Thiohalophilus sp.]|jgi:short-subunit dehydrogenase